MERPSAVADRLVLLNMQAYRDGRFCLFNNGRHRLCNVDILLWSGQWFEPLVHYVATMLKLKIRY